jgi:glycosyltransferase involved in cell wall biosynthesis
VVLEAFQQQTPVICRHLGGIPEYVQESGGGLTFETNEQLVAAMDGMIENPSLRRQLGQRGYHVYLRQWTAEAHLNRYLGLVREIAAARGRRLPTDGGRPH